MARDVRPGGEPEVSLLPFPPCAPGLNPVGNIRQHLRQSHLANRAWATCVTIADACCDAWSAVVARPETMAPVSRPEEAKAVTLPGWRSVVSLTHATWSIGLHAGPAYLPIMELRASTSVLYNASCPVCSFEIGHYARHAAETGLPIRFDDLNSDAREAWGIDADTAARRLHVLHEGALTSGISAFLVLWAQMPRYRWLARVVGLPGVRQVASAAYDHVLAPAIYHWHLRRSRRSAARVRH